MDDFDVFIYFKKYFKLLYYQLNLGENIGILGILGDKKDYLTTI